MKKLSVAEYHQAMAWLLGGDTGASSKRIMLIMTGFAHREIYSDTPSDNSDFGRCVRLLKLFPQWRLRLPEVAARQGWKYLVEEWDALTTWYERLPENKYDLLFSRRLHDLVDKHWKELP